MMRYSDTLLHTSPASRQAWVAHLEGEVGDMAMRLHGMVDLSFCGIRAYHLLGTHQVNLWPFQFPSFPSGMYPTIVGAPACPRAGGCWPAMP